MSAAPAAVPASEPAVKDASPTVADYSVIRGKVCNSTLFFHRISHRCTTRKKQESCFYEFFNFPRFSVYFALKILSIIF